MMAGRAPDGRVLAATPAAAAPQAAQFLEAADAIGCRIVRDAIWDGARCSWLVWTKEPVGARFASAYRAAPTGLYLGIAGIALFLAHLARLTGDRAQREAAVGALAQVEAQLQTEDPRQFGFYTGSSGAAWVLIEAGRMWDERWTQTGMEALRRVAKEAALEGSYDLLGGQAGLAAVLAAVGVREGDEALLEAAELVADRLAASAERRADHASWPGTEAQLANLLGLSHGTTGIALALLEVNQVRPKAPYADAAAAALRYERGLFDPSRRNWPDFRIAPGEEGSGPRFPVAWCHGATGIGMARLRMLDLLPDDPFILAELDAATQTAAAMINVPLDPASSDVTLCHGVTGNNELILMVGDRLQRADALAAAAHVGDILISSWHRQNMPWGCGIPDCGETVSLLTGTAGIGYHFLRLHDPGAVPPILLPPNGNVGSAPTAAEADLETPGHNRRRTA